MKNVLSVIAKKISKMNIVIELYDYKKKLNNHLSSNYVPHNFVKVATTGEEELRFQEVEKLKIGIARKRIQRKLLGIVYEEFSAKNKGKSKRWAYYVTDLDIVRYIQHGNENHKWRIDTSVLLELRKEFKAAKKVLHHATMEDAIRTSEEFISCLEAILTSIATPEQRAFVLSNSKTRYCEDIPDSKLSHFDYRLKLFMGVLRDPQHQETMLERAKEFIINVKKKSESNVMDDNELRGGDELELCESEIESESDVMNESPHEELFPTNEETIDSSVSSVTEDPSLMSFEDTTEWMEDAEAETEQYQYININRSPRIVFSSSKIDQDCPSKKYRIY